VKLLTTTLAVIAVAMLSSCDNPKPRQVPPDPMALPPPPLAPAAPPGAGMSGGLTRLAGAPGFYLDRIGQAPDPANRQPAVTSGAQPIVVDGFAFDPTAKAPAKGVDVVVDGKAYGAVYGHARPDVANFFKTPALAATGYKVTLPAGALSEGSHSVAIRVVSADGQGYFESRGFPFQVN
jgi:hypothetical protein